MQLSPWQLHFVLLHCQYMPRDDQPLDFASSLADCHEPRITVNPFNRVFTRIAVSAMDLDRVTTDTLCHFSCEHLCHGSFLVIRTLLFLEPGGFVQHIACHLDLGCRICQHPLNGLLIGDGFPKGFALSCVIDCIFKCSLCQSK